jgi:hypothetical protein
LWITRSAIPGVGHPGVKTAATRLPEHRNIGRGDDAAPEHVPQGAGDDLGVSVVPVEAGLGDHDTDRCVHRPG